jgi:hypothetical protein
MVSGCKRLFGIPRKTHYLTQSSQGPQRKVPKNHWMDNLGMGDHLATTRLAPGFKLTPSPRNANPHETLHWSPSWKSFLCEP